MCCYDDKIIDNFEPSLWGHSYIACCYDNKSLKPCSIISPNTFFTLPCRKTHIWGGGGGEKCAILKTEKSKIVTTST